MASKLPGHLGKPEVGISFALIIITSPNVTLLVQELQEF